LATTLLNLWYVLEKLSADDASKKPIKALMVACCLLIAMMQIDRDDIDAYEVRSDGMVMD